MLGLFVHYGEVVFCTVYEDWVCYLYYARSVDVDLGGCEGFVGDAVDVETVESVATAVEDAPELVLGEVTL